jgi:membrane protease YdiL (CAAX protease family)
MYALAAISLTLLGYKMPTAALYILIGLAGASTIGTQIVANAYTGQFYPMAVRATGLGWALGVGRSGAILAPILIGVLVGNVWEETAWAGFLQSRLMARYGLLVGSLLTAVPFFVIHIPLAYSAHGWRGTTWSEAALDWTLIALAAPFFRYLVGTQLIDTGGSVLAVGLLHAAFNASGQMAAIDGWQQVPAMIVLTLAVVAYRRYRGRSFSGVSFTEAQDD